MEMYCMVNRRTNASIPLNVADSMAVARSTHKINSKSVIRPIASYYIRRIIEVKRQRGESSITKSEMASLVRKLICLQYNINNKYDMLCIRKYLADKIPTLIMLKFSEGDYRNSIRNNNSKTRNYLTYKSNSNPLIMGSVWGLHRHEQAFHPFLSLAHRPQILRENIWSVTNKDLELWNQCVVPTCGCPPLFGYTIPVDFFGNPFNLKTSCPVNNIHLTIAQEGDSSNEHILQGVKMQPMTEHPFLEFEERIVPKLNIRYFSEQLQEVLSSVHNVIDEKEKFPEIYKLDEGYESSERVAESLWSANMSGEKVKWI